MGPTTYAGFQINCEPIRYVNFLIMFLEFGVKVDASQIFDFQHFQYIVNGDILVGVSGQNVSFVVEDGIFLDRSSAFYARQFGFFTGAGGGGAVIIIVDVAAVVIGRCTVGHNAETVSVVPRQFPAFDIRVPCGCLSMNQGQ